MQMPSQQLLQSIALYAGVLAIVVWLYWFLTNKVFGKISFRVFNAEGGRHVANSIFRAALVLGAIAVLAWLLSLFAPRQEASLGFQPQPSPVPHAPLAARRVSDNLQPPRALAPQPAVSITGRVFQR